MTNPNPYEAPITTAAPLSPSEEKQWALLTHLLGIFVGIPTAIVFYVLYRERGPFVRAHTATELNFQITVICASVLGFVISFSSIFASFTTRMPEGSSGPAGIGLFFVGYFLIIGIRITAVVLGIFATVAANKGRYFQYPAIRFVR